jgi:preprotein translocase subunit SecG
MELISILLYIVFVLSAIVLVVVVLLQEGRGGGLTDALGTAGQATFGVGASGINRFTFVMIGTFLLSALAIHYVNRTAGMSTIVRDAPADMPVLPGGLGAPPTDGGGAPPPANGGTPATPPQTPPSDPPPNPPPGGGGGGGG